MSDLPVNQIICGSALEVLRGFPAESVNCCISSPPYWSLRDYGLEPQIWDGDKNCGHRWRDNTYVRNTDKTAGQKQKTNIGSVGRDKPIQNAFCSFCGAWRGSLGLEPTFELYLKHLCDIYDEVKRVLRKDGSCWVNLGDTYGGSGGHHQEGHIVNPESRGFQHLAKSTKEAGTKGNKSAEKCLCLIPERFAIEMVNRGWILRNVIIWAKPNPMPSSAKDRFTVDFEQVFFFVKSKRYFFEPQYEPFLTESNAERPRMGQGQNTQYEQKRGEKKQDMLGKATYTGFNARYQQPSLGRNKRCVWTIPTQSCPEAHFATFPEKLVEPMIKAGCPEFVCKKCGKAREKIYETDYRIDNAAPKGQETKAAGCEDTNFKSMKFAHGYSEHNFKGYTDCGCNAGFRSGIMLDPFVVRARPVRSLPN